ncbi:DUF2306 domain-containing protein [Flavilitoribacter nigricans]|uniref:DUF2306 domain-containing protein n=1 Tax=Flavilitoribacter nigricans (strain ATCC 23147 / DSM 23189 / NBRC 102662 / NCIMB 1420 / SS-2) TaxID=1122177 RepID=A0A2D0MZ10_FLAN2|nr:DUF2306 domain-containing protein [Flavilitoribacter nigricans]PHN01356.1 hypothetical protein CRP01_37460 [Flavilitoribacter nigricans DSM 23189 = NBRC 102662]
MKKQYYLGIWGLIIAVNFYYIYNFPLNYFNVEAWQAAFGPMLITHIVFGLIAIVVGPFQFFPSIRKKHPHFHRLSGRVYLFSILIASIAAIWLAVFHKILVDKHYIFALGGIGLAVAWLTTSGMALWAVKKRQFDQHREWMVRSYVVTCGFTTFRIVAVNLNAYIQMDGFVIGDIMAWACWAVPLLFAEVILQARKINRAEKLSPGMN